LYVYAKIITGTLRKTAKYFLITGVQDGKPIMSEEPLYNSKKVDAIHFYAVITDKNDIPIGKVSSNSSSKFLSVLSSGVDIVAVLLIGSSLKMQR